MTENLPTVDDILEMLVSNDLCMCLSCGLCFDWRRFCICPRCELKVYPVRKYCDICGALGHRSKECPLRRLQEQQEHAAKTTQLSPEKKREYWNKLFK